MIPNPCIEVYTSPADCPSVPAWFAEVVVIVQHLAAKEASELRKGLGMKIACGVC